MIRLTIVFCLMIFYGAAPGQNILQAEYFIDKDAGPGKNTLVNLPAATDASFWFTVNLSNVSPGPHKLFIRTKDGNNRWSQTTTRYIDVLRTEGRNDIVQGEYFFDQDPGFGAGTPITVASPDSAITLDVTAAVNGLLPGYHKLYTRLLDRNGKWSLSSIKTVEITLTGTYRMITHGEYFFDEDPGVGRATALTISPQDSMILQSFSAAVAGLTAGYHKLYLRLKDTEETWSQTLRQNVQIRKSEGPSNVIVAEYFFRTDAGVGECEELVLSNPSPDGSFSFNISPANTIAGADTLFIRVKENGEENWSLTQWKVNLKTLPLTILDFTAAPQNNAIQLDWKTTHEINLWQFTIQRSPDGITFTPIGREPTKGDNSYSENQYRHLDATVGRHSGKIYYRLQIEDRDGKFSFSKVVSVSLAQDRDVRFTVLPNPASSYVTIQIKGSPDHPAARIVISDMAGRVLIKEKLLNTDAQQINIAALAKGMYLVRIVTNEGIHTEKLVVE